MPQAGDVPCWISGRGVPNPRQPSTMLAPAPRETRASKYDESWAKALR
eukprot:CAMPEP_0174373904 /NCGR_PEP_ID=MMETSP0811_2-20130205/108932_1 /TAXON_ID=73025 ORGANISM="Eutreptiella gymnastica-like, Strain CCMP1594" /NCGR_SAMPLE_ID=MMETSP0811_2 /ASSEMBLY_ACC=CAM_ASM_000667 /LENGTH=47 /DNA_ID= /DNA_START= /DNA_END= /DNA_ORIENTATION=